jgi:hypothetical protein
VPYAQRAINIMTNTDGYTPAEIRFGMFNRLDSLKELIVPELIAKEQRNIQETLRQKLIFRKAKKDIRIASIFKPNEKVIIRNPFHLKRDSAHKPYLGPFRVEKQTDSSVWVSKESDPSIRKEVKISEVFRFIDSADKACDTVHGLTTVPSLQPTTASSDESMIL